MKKGNTCLIDLPTGGGVGLCFTHGTLHGLEVSSMSSSRFVCSFPWTSALDPQNVAWAGIQRKVCQGFCC